MEGYELRQVRKEATAVADSVCRGATQLSVVPITVYLPFPVAGTETQSIPRASGSYLKCANMVRLTP